MKDKLLTTVRVKYQIYDRNKRRREVIGNITMKEKIISVLLSLTLVLTMTPALALLGTSEAHAKETAAPLTFTAQKTGSVTLRYKTGSDLMISTDGGSKWSDYEEGTKIKLAEGESVSFRGKDIITDKVNHFIITGRIAASGDVRSLTDGINFSSAELSEGCYEYMFGNCANLITAPELKATALAENCYRGMFYGCTGLIEAPELPATQLADECYYEMFGNCTGLKKAPELPAIQLAKSCYCYMFDGCTSLTTVPKLDADVLTESCYWAMFSGCTSLKKAPELPATQLASQCYEFMFNNCTSLKKAPELPATQLANECYYEMFKGCTSLTTAPELNATDLAGSCYMMMFEECTGLTAVPKLEATELAEMCYFGMFYKCTGINLSEEPTEECTEEWSIPEGAVEDTSWNYYMFYETGGTFTGDPEVGKTYYQKGNAGAIVLTDIKATAITKGQALSKSKITGTALQNGAPLEGTWSWENPSTVPTYSDSDSTEFTVIFTPADETLAPVTDEVTITVNIPIEVKTIVTKRPVVKDKSIQIKWVKRSGAVKYVVYGNKCGKNKKYKKLATVTDTSFTFKKLDGKKLKKHTAYKLKVLAKNSKGQTIGKTLGMHIITGKYKGKVGNTKSITLNATKKAIGPKKTFKIKAKVKNYKGLKSMLHTSKVRYFSSNSNVAEVSSKGVVTAIRKGTCTIYATSTTGVTSKVYVTVKNPYTPDCILNDGIVSVSYYEVVDETKKNVYTCKIKKTGDTLKCIEATKNGKDQKPESVTAGVIEDEYFVNLQNGTYMEIDTQNAHMMLLLMMENSKTKTAVNGLFYNGQYILDLYL